MRITLVEDNQSLAKGIAYQLQDAGHSVDLIFDGDEAELFLKQERSDLIILDINLPGKSGLALLRELRARDDPRPVILLTARAETSERVAGLDAGADDYLVKPFEMEELSARIRALGRRKSQAPRQTVGIGELKLDIQTHQLFHHDQILDVPLKELAVLATLASPVGRTVPKAELLDQLYGTGSASDEKVIEVYVSRLRKRLAAFDITIKVHRGIGYALETDEPTSS